MIRISIQKVLQMATGEKPLTADLVIPDGAFVVVAGVSGTGKTSLLRMLAGLLKPDRGLIQKEEVCWYSAEHKIDLPVQQRNVGFVFQDLALFPNMTVLENLQFAAAKNKWGYNKKDALTNAYLERLLRMTDMQSFAGRLPQTLSGGQQQRVAIIRALAAKPGLLLLDEPFAALDRQMRFQLRKELRALHTEFGLTTILVSHDSDDMNGRADLFIEIKAGQAEVKTVPLQRRGTAMPEAVSPSELTGHVSRILPYGSTPGYIVELRVGTELFRLPVDADTAKTLQEGAGVLIHTRDGHIEILPQCS